MAYLPLFLLLILPPWPTVPYLVAMLDGQADAVGGAGPAVLRPQAAVVAGAQVGAVPPLADCA